MKTVIFRINYSECTRRYSKYELVEFQDATADRLVAAGVAELYVARIPDPHAEIESDPADVTEISLDKETGNG
jgi:hypothetical protein